MSTDRELLELAAKAAGWHETKADTEGWISVRSHPLNEWEIWNPLIDDGDALRLAVKLNLLVFTARSLATANAADRDGPCIREVFRNDSDDCAATRRAITRAAAAIGEQK